MPGAIGPAMGEIEGRARRGSRLQVQIYVNRHPEELSEAVLGAFPELSDRGGRIRWTAPLEAENFREPRDRDFLHAIGYERLAQELAAFWPVRGPVWDALAVVEFPSGPHGVILGEGKSYPEEFYSGGTKATSTRSVETITRSLARTQEWLGLNPDPERWMYALRGHPRSSLYQSANRYAHLYWLREVVSVEAWLVHLLFVDDTTHLATSRARWRAGLKQVERELGLEGVPVPHAGHVFLPALGRFTLP
ncbi:MAG: hypothetical protein H0V20_00665 [Actinobacteria bacterium]|nr:hypothetical protein [Actinomycetota bacterium]